MQQLNTHVNIKAIIMNLFIAIWFSLKAVIVSELILLKSYN